MLVNNQLLVVAFVPRSGSNYLCDMLRRTGLAAPLEYYYPYDFKERSEKWGEADCKDRVDTDIITSPIKWFDYVVSCGALKATWHSYQTMLHEAGDSYGLIDAKFIYLRRNDKLKQAISWLRAEQSGRWTSLDHANGKYFYDRDSINKKILHIVDHETRWNKFFENIPHLDLFYEDLNYDTIKLIEQWVGRHRNNDYWSTNTGIETQYSIMRDTNTDEWIDYYIGN